MTRQRRNEDSTRMDMVANEEPRDINDDEEQEPRKAKSSKEFVEYMGSEQYGTEFEDRRVISRRDVKEGWDVSMSKDLVWTKARSGPNRGRMLLSTEGIPEEVMERLREEPGFRVVTVEEG